MQSAAFQLHSIIQSTCLMSQRRLLDQVTTSTLLPSYKAQFIIQDVSDQVESGGGGSEAALERGARRVVRGDWRAHVCTAVASDLRARRTYRGDRAAHLLRAIRNKVCS